MAAENKMRLPAPKTEHCLRYDRLSGGLNLFELDYRLNRNESPEMKNMMWRDGALNCRDGQVWLNDTARGTGWAMAERPFHGRLVAHAGGALYALTPATGEVQTLLTGLPQNAGSFFVYNEKLYYKNRGGYAAVAWDAQTDTLGANPVQPYVPVTVINADPETGAGDLYQPVNRLSPKRTVWYTPRSGQRVYQLPETGIDAVTGIRVNDNPVGLAPDAIDTAAGTVTFPDSFYTLDTARENSVRITYSKTDAAAVDSVMDCCHAAVYGGTGALCVVLGGCRAQPNAYFWNGGHIRMDAGYFPAAQYQLAGDSSDPITGFGRQQSYLIVFKADSLGRSSLSLTEIDGRLTLDMPYVPINSELGCDLPGTVRLVGNNLVWAHSRRGVLRLLDSSAAYENNVACLSRKVNGGRHGLGLLADLRRGAPCACDDGRRYLLAADGCVWVWDHELSAPGDPSWFYWTNIPARAFAVDGEQVYHLDGQGRFSVFRRICADYGEAIEKVYRFATEHFGGYDRLKNVNSVILVMRSDTKSRAQLSYITDHEIRRDKTELSARFWALSPRDLRYRCLNGRGFAAVFRRKCCCRGVRHFTMRLTNDRVGQDLSVVSAEVYFNYQGRQR